MRAFTKSLSKRCRNFSTWESSPQTLFSAKSGFTMGEYRTYNALDIERAYVGQSIELPYEVTVGAGWQELWASCFYSPSRCYSSSAFAQKLGFQAQLLPFSFLFNQAVGMSHVDETREVLDVGFSNGIYVAPAFAGQTFNKTFVIKRIRNSSNNQDTIVTFQCSLLNAHTKELVFTVDKTMLFRGLINQRAQSRPPSNPAPQPESVVHKTIVSNAGALPMCANTALRPGQLLLHGVARPMGRSNSMSLSSLFGMTHPTIFNHAMYKDEGLLVPGGLVLAMTMSASSRELSEVLNNGLVNANFFNKTSPIDTVGAMTFVHDIKEVANDLEQVSVTTVGVKNVDMRELAEVELPLDLFIKHHNSQSMESLISEHCPQLSGNVLLTSRRQLLRQGAFQGYSIPLL